MLETALSLHMGLWDIILIVIVAFKGTLVAYLPNPRWKAFFLLLPIPFTLAVLSLGRPIDVTNVMGLALLLGYAFLVKILYQRLHVPIIGSICISALGYCVIGSVLALIIPRTDEAFLLASVFVCIIASVLHCVLDDSAETNHRSLLPVWKKFMTLMLVLIFIITVKSFLQGFMTVFPMLGVIICYEARFSLRTVCRYVPVTMLTFTPMMATCYVLQDRMGILLALSVGWIVYLIILPMFILPMWSKCKEPAIKG